MIRLLALAALAAVLVAVVHGDAHASPTARVPEVVRTPALTYPTYGNTAIASCTFASAADWVQVVRHRQPNELEVITGFYRAGGDPEWGITVGQFSWYWQHHGIGGFRQRVVRDRLAERDDWQLERDIAVHRAVLVDAEEHMVTVAGYDDSWEAVQAGTSGPEIITYGEVRRLTWKEWDSFDVRVFIVVHA